MAKNPPKTILFLGETYRADAQTWIRGVEDVSGLRIETMEIALTRSRFLRILKFVGFGLTLLRSNFSKSYDLVLAERATSYGFFSLFVNAKKRVVAQQGITDVRPATGFSGFFKSILQRLVYQNVDLIHAWGDVMVPAMIQSKADPERIMILPKGIDLDQYRFEENKDPRLAIVTRSLRDIYNHVDILEALALLKKEGIVIKLILVGGGEIESFVKERCKILGLESHVEFTGIIPNSELPHYLQKASIYLSVPYTEGVSASLFEAMACGCFPIVTDLPGTRAFIRNGENGILVPVNDPASLAEGIKAYLDEEARYQEAIRQNRKFIEDQVELTSNMKVIWNRYLELFQS